jgi:urea transport system permease protein
MAVVTGWTLSQPVAAADSSTDTSSDAALLEQIAKLAGDDAAARKQALFDLAKSGDSRLEAFLENYRTGSVYLWNEQIVVCTETEEDDDFNELAPLTHPLTGEPVLGDDGKQAKPDVLDLGDISPSRDERKVAAQARFFLRLFSPDPEVRLSGAKKCGDPPYNIDAVELLGEIAQKDSDNKIRYTARESQLLIQLSGQVPEQNTEERIEAIRQLGEIKSLRALPRLESLLDELKPADAALEEVVGQSLAPIRAHQKTVDRFSNVFRGLSLGSVLILMALGLAITFGLMGVINMAHGELMMIGAYTTYEMQLLFNHTPGAPQNAYYLCALPAAFLVAALVGMLMEELVVRHLYRRPLESLLATWGIGLVLIQIARIRYGDNIGVNAPEWARGSLEVMQDVNLPYARLFIMGLCLLAVLAVWWQMNHTRIGLHIRATMQSRDMARSLGVNTRRVDRFTFAFGAGLAGVAGYAWTLIGGVTPDMGQTNFIVDSFLVVVVGGVGELLGVVFSGLGIGLLTKVVEPMEFWGFTVGAIWAKVFVLVCVVAFIQFKPAGLFAPKGRLADDR